MEISDEEYAHLKKIEKFYEIKSKNHATCLAELSKANVRIAELEWKYENPHEPELY